MDGDSSIYDINDGKDALFTHLMINKTLCGELVELKQSYAKTSLLTNSDMSVDEYKLIHGGFIFGAADFAAMAAVNDPYSLEALEIAQSRSKRLVNLNDPLGTLRTEGLDGRTRGVLNGGMDNSDWYERYCL